MPLDDPRYLRLERMLMRDVGGRLDVRGLAAAAWAAAVLNRPTLLSALLGHSAEQLRGASLHEHAVVAWALGVLHLGRQQKLVLANIADGAAHRLATFDPKSLALRVLHDLSAPPGPVLTRNDAHQPLRQLSAVNPQSLTRLLSGFAACQHPPPRRFVALLGNEATRLLPLFDASTLAFLLAAHAKMGVQPHPRLLAAAPSALASALLRDEGAPRAGALAVWAFARMRMHPGAPLLDAGDAVLGAVPGLSGVSTARLVGAVWGFGALSTRPAQCWPALSTALASRDLRLEDQRMLAVALARLERDTGFHAKDAALWGALPPAAREAPLGRVIWLRCRPLAGAA